MKFRSVFWDVLSCKIIVDRRFRGTCCLHHQGDHSSQKTNLNIILLFYINKTVNIRMVSYTGIGISEFSIVDKDKLQIRYCLES
jgi:hypothetical protein